MPQLTWSKDLCPRSLTVNLEWDQLKDCRTLRMVCHAQDNSYQGEMEGDVSGLGAESVSDIIHSAFMVWDECTPGVALRHACTLIRAAGRQAYTTLR